MSRFKSKNSNTTWKVAQYHNTGNAPVIDGITQFLNVLLPPISFSVHMSTTIWGGNDCFGAIIYDQNLQSIPDVNSLNSTWNLYSTGQDLAVNVYNDVIMFMNSKITAAQAFYGKFNLVTTTNYQPDFGVDIISYFWYMDTISSYKLTHLNADNACNGDVGDTSWFIKFFQEDTTDTVAGIMTEVLNSIGGVRSQCTSIAMDLYSNNTFSEGYGGVLLPGALQTVPDSSTLNGNWFVNTIIDTPQNAFQSMQQFMTNLTDAQICYGQLSLSTQGLLNESIVNFWYQGVNGADVGHHDLV